MDAQCRQAARQIGVGGGEQAALAHGAEVLGGEETEAVDVGERGDAAALVFGADGLGRVAEDAPAVAPRDGGDRVHVGRAAVEMDRHHGLDAGRAAGHVLEPRRIHVVGEGIDVDEDRLSARAHDGAGGGEEGEGRGDDAVAGANAGGQQRQKEGIRAGAADDGVRGAAVGGELLFQQCDVLAQDEALGIDDARQRSQNLVTQWPVDGAQIEQRNAPGGGKTGHREPLHADTWRQNSSLALSPVRGLRPGSERRRNGRSQRSEILLIRGNAKRGRGLGEMDQDGGAGGACGRG